MLIVRMTAILATLTASLAWGADIPFIPESPGQPQIGAIDGTINGKPATHSLMGNIDVFSVNPGSVTSFDAAEKMCTDFHAGGINWELTNLLTFYAVAMAGGGASVEATKSKIAGDGQVSLWVKGENEDEAAILRHSQKFLLMGSGDRTYLVDIAELVDQIKSGKIKPEPGHEDEVQTTLNLLTEVGFPVICVSKNLRRDRRNGQ